MKISSRAVNDALIATVNAPRIDAAVTLQFKEHMRELANSDAARIILDLSNVSFLDSSGLGAIVAVKKLLGAGRSLEIASLTPNVSKVFQLTRMDTVFSIHPTAQAAIEIGDEKF